MLKRKNLLLTPVTLLLVISFAAQCGGLPATVVVTKEVEKVVTQVVEKVVTQEVVVTKEVEKEVVVTPTPAPEAQARAETLNIGVSTRLPDPTNFNMYGPGENRDGTGLIQMVYEYFFHYNKLTDEYIPWLAEGYEYNDDFTSITVRLRPEVTWNDGEPFTADDVVFTYELLLANPGMIWAAETAAWVDAVEKIDDLTVKFNLSTASR